MAAPYFLWKGVDSRNMNIWVQKYPPITRPPERFQEIKIPGRSGSLTLLEGDDIYESYVREMTIMPQPGADLHQIMNWLRGQSDVVFGCEPSMIQWARIFDEASFVRQFAQQRSAVIRFLCDPFKKNASSETPIAVGVASPYTINNPGDVVAYPLIVVSASGGIAITVNGTRTVITGVSSTASIDCKSGAVIADGNSVRTYGDCGCLAVGNNTISWEGTITAMTITPRWRYL